MVVVHQDPHPILCRNVRHNVRILASFSYLQMVPRQLFVLLEHDSSLRDRKITMTAIRALVLSSNYDDVFADPKYWNGGYTTLTCYLVRLSIVGAVSLFIYITCAPKKNIFLILNASFILISDISEVLKIRHFIWSFRKLVSVETMYPVRVIWHGARFCRARRYGATRKWPTLLHTDVSFGLTFSSCAPRSRRPPPLTHPPPFPRENKVVNDYLLTTRK